MGCASSSSASPTVATPAKISNATKTIKQPSNSPHNNNHNNMNNCDNKTLSPIPDYTSQLEKKLCEKDRMIEQLQSELIKVRTGDLQPNKMAISSLSPSSSSVDGDSHGAVGSAGNYGYSEGALNNRGLTEHTSGEGANKRVGILGESAAETQSTVIKKGEKDERLMNFLLDALMGNDFLHNVQPALLREMASCMYSRDCPQDFVIIREGDKGEHLYVCEEGRLEVRKGGKLLGIMEPPRCFGELALLYNCERTASVVALQQTKLWVLDRAIFRAVMMENSKKTQNEVLNFLRKVPVLRGLTPAEFTKLADSVELQMYAMNDCIVREGESADSFYIIKNGKVTVTCMGTEGKEVQLRELTQFQYFGERALLGDEKRTATVHASEAKVELYCIYKEVFHSLIGNLSKIREKYPDELSESAPEKPSESPIASEPLPGTSDKFSSVRLDDLHIHALLGKGGFGEVFLVTLKDLHNHPSSTAPSSDQSMALKRLRKQQIVETRQQSHIFNERDILLQARSPFICRLYKTFKDPKFVFMLLELCLGGELWRYLRNSGYFSETTTRFYLGCAIEALDYLHSRGIVYRDLKPENLILDKSGYAKLCDFGFAKKIGSGKKTWTFCGTPEYVSPEIILNKGHDFTCDYWSLGVLAFECRTGRNLFTGADHISIYKSVLQGIEGKNIENYRNLSGRAVDFIRRLCRLNPIERLGNGVNGVDAIRQHKFFHGFHWDALKHNTLQSPFQPKISSHLDISNFDHYEQDNRLPPDEFSGWDMDF